MAAPIVNEDHGVNSNRVSIQSSSESSNTAVSTHHGDEDQVYEDIQFGTRQLQDLARTLSRRTTNPGPGEDVGPHAKLESNLRAFLQRADADGNSQAPAQASVYFKNLVVTGSGSGATYQDNVTSIFTGPFEAIKGLISKKAAPQKTILHGIDGVVRDGEMLLVLGRPGSGCSTLLKSLAGFTDGYEGWSGNVNYSGVSVDVIKKRFRGDVVYNPEGLCTARKTMDDANALDQLTDTFPISALGKPLSLLQKRTHQGRGSMAYHARSTSRQSEMFWPRSLAWTTSS